MRRGYSHDKRLVFTLSACEGRHRDEEVPLLLLSRAGQAFSQLALHPKQPELCRAVIQGIALPAHHIQHVVRAVRLMKDTVQNAEIVS